MSAAAAPRLVLDCERCPPASTLLEQSSRGPDPDFFGIDTSGYLGDFTTSAVSVPSQVLPDGHRYMIRLAAVSVAPNERRTVYGFRQGVQLGFLREVQTDAGTVSIPLMIEQTTPWWASQEGGNLCWHVRWLKGPQQLVRAFDPGQPGGTSIGSFSGTQPGILYVPPRTPYIAPAHAIPPGDPFGGLGTFHDLKFPPRQHAAVSDVRTTVVGPGILGLYVTCRQINPDAVVPLGLTAAELAELSPEDRFQQVFRLMQYRKVYGSILMDGLHTEPHERAEVQFSQPFPQGYIAEILGGGRGGVLKRLGAMLRGKGRPR